MNWWIAKALNVLQRLETWRNPQPSVEISRDVRELAVPMTNEARYAAKLREQFALPEDVDIRVEKWGYSHLRRPEIVRINRIEFLPSAGRGPVRCERLTLRGFGWSPGVYRESAQTPSELRRLLGKGARLPAWIR